MERRAWQAAVYGVAKSWTQLSTHTHTYMQLQKKKKTFQNVKTILCQNLRKSGQLWPTGHSLPTPELEGRCLKVYPLFDAQLALPSPNTSTLLLPLRLPVGAIRPQRHLNQTEEWLLEYPLLLDYLYHCFSILAWKLKGVLQMKM